MPRKPRGAAPAMRPSVGRPPFEPTPMQRETVKVMVAGGIDQAAIAGVLQIGARTLQKHFRREIAVGAAEVNVIVVAAHLKRIKAGDMRAIEWWEKSRMGWTERVIVDDGKPLDTPMRVIVELVGDAAPVKADPASARPTSRPGFDTGKLVQLVG